jgi:hypothetical protein
MRHDNFYGRNFLVLVLVRAASQNQKHSRSRWHFDDMPETVASGTPGSPRFARDDSFQQGGLGAASDEATLKYALRD